MNDQCGSPTYAGRLAQVLIELISKDARGLFNVASRDAATWFDVACEVVAVSNLPTKILPQTSQEALRPAPRPAYSVLDVTKVERFLGFDCQSWRLGVREHLEFLERTERNMQ